MTFGKNRGLNDPSESIINKDLYNSTYYIQHMDGSKEFIESEGEILPERLKVAINLAEPIKNKTILDIGSGRGEVLWFCTKMHATTIGLDYSHAALEISKILRRKAITAGQGFNLIQASAMTIPLDNNKIDIVFLLDIVEHLSPNELKNTLSETYRLLKPNGRVIIHTMPNLNYYKWGYPIYRQLKRLFGESLPSDPRERWYCGETHINIQNPKMIRRSLELAGFNSIKVWLQPLSGNKYIRRFISLFVWRRILVNDILAIAIK